MSKIMLSAAVMTSICLLVSDGASAGWRRDSRRSARGVPASAVAAAPVPATANYPATPAPVAAARSTNAPIASAPSAPAYRSYSYDSARVYGGTYVPARPYVQPLAPSQSHFFRADRKMHDPLWYRVQ